MNNRVVKLALIVTFLIVISSLSFIFSIQWGAVKLSFSEILNCFGGHCGSAINESILWQVRIPRALMGFCVGAGLACCGAVLQIATRNPLADPYLFGIVAGAGLGVVAATLFFPHIPLQLVPFAAFAGAISAVLLVIALARYFFRVEMILLAGVAIAFMFGAITQLLLYIGEPFASNRIIFWLMGSLSSANFSQLAVILPLLFSALIIVLLSHRHLDALMLDDDTAQTLGINVALFRMGLLLGSALITAVIVAFCGGIGFVGLMLPHIVRFLIGGTSARLLIGCFFFGGIFLMWVDVLARQILPGQEVPIGIITSATGSVFFIGLMLQSKRKLG
ncbi:FecCD family ABC transporter permease [Alteromonas sp. a30]|uniref:FecCD family ABC transporter permease n=1 Tax=Alteromonas sp. a30 TaxID=2730917 RepID=UPI00227E7C76|nr:iron ABC transporter permease [Alteromonas sp. a30]MCY7295470.1 iron ABC transporter permease [Alteromonas sp. a30]